MSSFGNSIAVGKPMNADSENQLQVLGNFLKVEIVGRPTWNPAMTVIHLTAFKTFKQYICQLIFSGPLNKKEEKGNTAYDSTLYH